MILQTPAEVKNLIAPTTRISAAIDASRAAVESVLNGTDSRLLVIAGPCSLADKESAVEYATRFKALEQEVGDTVCLVMRAYFHKPRTTLGWKGLLIDPYLDGSSRIDEGIRLAREILLELSAVGLPLATEALDPLTYNYLDDLISWTAIGARTTESQVHREYASGLLMPVGFKNSVDGSLTAAVNAVTVARTAHRFLGMSSCGRPAILETKGNSQAHIVLRGGPRPNYDSVSIAECERAMTKAGISPMIVVDCSHGNSGKNHNMQPRVFRDVLSQRVRGTASIKGIMLESNLLPGAQPFPKSRAELVYGQSVTDACLGWDATVELILEAAQKLRQPSATKPERSYLSEQTQALL